MPTHPHPIPSNIRLNIVHEDKNRPPILTELKNQPKPKNKPPPTQTWDGAPQPHPSPQNKKRSIQNLERESIQSYRFTIQITKLVFGIRPGKGSQVPNPSLVKGSHFCVLHFEELGNIFFNKFLCSLIRHITGQIHLDEFS